MAEILFWAMAFGAAGASLGVVLSRNPVSSLLFMIVTLASMAGIFVLFEAHFLAAIQVIVYAGAIMVLFLFVIMLLNLGHEYEPDIRRGVGAIVGFVVCGAVAGTLFRSFRGTSESEFFAPFDGASQIDQALAEHGVVGAIGQSLFTDYVVPFEITAILLLVAIVGALALAKKSV